MQFKIDLPVSTQVDLGKLTFLLITNDLFKKQFNKSLVFYMDTENVLFRSITNILRKVLSRDVAILFTATKQMDEKNC